MRHYFCHECGSDVHYRFETATSLRWHCSNDECVHSSGEDQYVGETLLIYPDWARLKQDRWKLYVDSLP